MTQINKPLANSIHELLKSRRLPATVIEVIGERASVQASGGGRMSNVRVVGITPAAGSAVFVEWNGHEPVIYTGGQVSGTVSQVSPIRSGSGSGITTQAPNRDPFSEAGWRVDETDLAIVKDKTRIQPSGNIVLGDGNVGQIVLDAPNSRILIEDDGIQTISIDGIASRISLGSVANQRVILDGKDAQYRLWAGADLPAVAPFSVDRLGAVKAESGLIGGWSITGTEIKKTGIVLDSSLDSIFVGASNPRLVVDGANKEIRSSSFASGLSGFKISGIDGSAEFNNVVVRGAIRASVFQKDTINISGGNLLVLDGDVLAADMSALDSSTLRIKGNMTFAVGDILRLKDGLNDEWLTVTSIASAPTYSVTRDRAGVYPANSNPAWKAGTAVANYKQSGAGGLLLAAGVANAPYLDIFTHAGSPWSGQNIRSRLGNLNGTYGYTSNIFGAAFGDPTAANVTVDSTNGFRLRYGTADYIKLDSTGAKVTGELNVTNPGKIIAANGAVTIDNTGISLVRGDSTENGIRWDTGAIIRTRGSDVSGYQQSLEIAVDGTLVGKDQNILLSAVTYHRYANLQVSAEYFDPRVAISTLYEYDYGDCIFGPSEISLHLHSGSWSQKLSIDRLSGIHSNTDITFDVNSVSGLIGKITFGTDTNIYRSAANVLKTDDSFTAVGSINADSPFRRSNTPGYIFVPVTPFSMTDTTGNTWGGALARNTGTYNFDANGNGNGLPTTTKALVVLMMGTWTTANNTYLLSAMPRGGSTAVGQVRSAVANVAQLMQAVVPTDANGDIAMTVAGANMTTALCRCVGYFM
jgi:hypothetical protein